MSWQLRGDPAAPDLQSRYDSGKVLFLDEPGPWQLPLIAVLVDQTNFQPALADVEPLISQPPGNSAPFSLDASARLWHAVAV